MAIDYHIGHNNTDRTWVGSDAIRIDPTPAAGPTDFVGDAAFTTQPALSIPSYEYSHPKNYIGALVATSLEQGKSRVLDAIAETVVSNPEPALRGAHTLRLIEYDSVGNPEPTPEGQVCLRHLARTHGGLDAARTAIADWKGTQTRFINLAPGYRLLGQTLLASDPALAYLSALLDATAPVESGDTTLPAVAGRLLQEDVVFASAILLRHTPESRQPVVGRASDNAILVKPAALESPDVYRGATTQQLKSILYHLGALTTPGTSTDRLTPRDEHWEYRHRI